MKLYSTFSYMKFFRASGEAILDSTHYPVRYYALTVHVYVYIYVYIYIYIYGSRSGGAWGGKTTKPPINSSFG